MNKRIIFLATCLFTFLGTSLSLFPMSEWDSDIMDFADLHADTIDQAEWEIKRSADKAGCLTVLNDLGVVSLLEEDLFLRSNIVQNRSLLDYPEFLPWFYDKNTEVFGINLFYNQTTRGFFTEKSSNVCSYLNITGDAFLAKLEAILREVQSLGIDFDANAPIDILNLFQTFTTQERRLGFMFWYKAHVQEWQIAVIAPWYYLERNFFVNEQVQADLENAIEQFTGQPANKKDAEAFQDAHLIADKLGIGDTRIMVDYPLVKTKGWKLRLGGLATLPTAGAFTKGLKGCSFRRLQKRPTFDFCEILEKALNNADISELNITEFFIAALDNGAAMLIETPLGNGGHVGLGAYIRNKISISEFISQSWTQNLVLRGFYSIEYLIPAWEMRSFRIPVVQAEFDKRNFDSQEPEDVCSNFDFITQQLTDRLFPIGLRTKVHNGIVFRWVSQLAYESKKRGFTIGTDTWLRTPEHLKNIQGCPKDILCQIDRLNAQAPLAYQAKVWGNVFFKVKKPARLWTLTLGGDTTIMNRGIGADYTLYFGVDCAF